MRPSLLAALLLAVATSACAPEPSPPVDGLAQARFALIPALASASVIEIEVHDAAGLQQTEMLAPPWLAETLITVAPGPGQHLEVTARVGDLVLAQGTSAEFEAPETGTIDVRVVIDLMGVLSVLPLDLPVGAVLGVGATPLAPFEGQPARYALAEIDGLFSATLPVGRYRLDFELTAEVLDWQLPASVEVEVRAGVEQRWAESFTPPELPLPDPIEATALEVLVVGGNLAGGLIREASDVAVRAVDAEGRTATAYRGEVRFEVLELVGVLPLELVPGRYRFTAEDQGSHVFVDGLRAPLTLVPGLVRLLVTDDAGLESTVEISVIP